MSVIAGSNRIPYRWFVKWVGTYSKRERKVRLFRVVWSRKGGPGVRSGGEGWSSKLSINLVARPFAWKWERFDLYATIFCVQIHKQRHWGGWIS